MHLRGVHRSPRTCQHSNPCLLAVNCNKTQVRMALEVLTQDMNRAPLACLESKTLRIAYVRFNVAVRQPTSFSIHAVFLLRKPKALFQVLESFSWAGALQRFRTDAQD
jgi:hypothetical protein